MIQMYKRAIIDFMYLDIFVLLSVFFSDNLFQRLFFFPPFSPHLSMHHKYLFVSIIHKNRHCYKI